nr:hypothetical protein [Natrialba sp. PRR66]
MFRTDQRFDRIMADDDSPPPDPPGVSPETVTGSDRIAAAADRFIRFVELIAAWVFAIIFAIGVVDLTLQICGRFERRPLLIRSSSSGSLTPASYC